MTLGELRAKRDKILLVAAKYGAANVRVFGSISRGEAGPASDIDLIVQMEPGSSLLDLIGFQQDVGAILGRSVDVITDEGVSPYLKERIKEEALAL